MPRPPAAALDVIGTLVRLGLAAVWLIAGVVKLSDPGATYVAVQAYELLPSVAVRPVATLLPLAELILGGLLLIGLYTRLAAVGSALLLAGFIVAVAQAWARGLSIDCGCFGGGGKVASGQTEYPWELAADAGLLLLAAWLVVRPRTRFAVGNTQEDRDGRTRARGAQAPAGTATGSAAGQATDQAEGRPEGPAAERAEAG